VIALNESISKDSFDKYDTYMILASTTGGYYDPEKNSLQLFNYADKDFDDIPTISLNKDNVSEKLAQFTSYLTSFLPLIFTFLFILAFLSFAVGIFLGTILFSIFTAFLAWILGKIWGVENTFGTWYLKAIHADTLHILLVWTIGWIIPLSIIPFFGTILVLIVLFVNDNFRK
jgi:hypothetical protein